MNIWEEILDQPSRVIHVGSSRETRIGIAVAPTRFDAKTRRTVCGVCRRALATGQTRCVCGAEFVGKLEA